MHALPAVRRSALADWHKSFEARMGVIGEVSAPICYRSFERELVDLRQNAALFDMAPFGLLRVSGPDPEKFLNRFFTIKTTDRPAGYLVEGLLCSEEGHVVDIVRVFYQENHLLLMTTPDRIEDVAAELAEQAILEGISIEPMHDTQAVFALIGPNALKIIDTILKLPSFSMEMYETQVASIFTARALIAHVTMAGEPAYLIITGSSYAPIVLQRIQETGIPFGPCGTAAFDIARIEAGELLPMFEADREVLPVELGLMNLVDRNKLDYHGRDAVLGSAQLGQGNWLVALKMSDGVIPRRNAPIVAEGARIGWVTSGAYSPRFQAGIGLAMIDRTFAIVGNTFKVQMRGHSFEAEIMHRPMYRSRHLPVVG